MRILIADDDDVSRLALGAMLTKQGYEVLAVADGQEAWEAFHAEDAPRLGTVVNCLAKRPRAANLGIVLSILSCFHRR